MIKESLTFDDILLRPKFSTVKSRKDIGLSVQLGPYTYSSPIITANMKTVSGYNMKEAVTAAGNLFIMHRFCPVTEQLSRLSYTVNGSASLGVKEEDTINAKRFWDFGVKIFTIDIAHGHSQSCIEMIRWLKKTFEGCFVIAGNIATSEGAVDLWKNGADCVKVGIGPSMVCTTRGQTGFGVAQLSALMDVHDVRRIYFKNKNKYIIADGGITSPGAAVKALCWSDFVMIGGLFAGCNEAPGLVKIIGTEMYKKYEGSSTYRSKNIEGVQGWVKSSGSYKDILEGLLDGIRSGCSYAGVHNVHDLQNNPQFEKITNAGLTESKPHDIRVD